ncbi:unnamed protein product [Phytophthora fragariaefolia]|uniref:Unnamed protein product n=1 Tax=Phytophthora fragariaefolia TaxID=1490495 RepID=A0A9W6XE65_9STRA|nr:unnamed protein product [Phytophthora fragariaefolia]
MENIGQAFVTAHDSYVVPASGTAWHMTIIPGVGSTDLAEDEKLALFTNSRAVYNKYTGLWEAPKGRRWNGHMWAPIARERMAPATVSTTTKCPTMVKMDKKVKVNMATAVKVDYAQQSEDGEEEGVAHTPPPAKKPKTTVRQTKAVTRQAKGFEAPRTTSETTATKRRFGEVKCYACNRFGHMARECPDDEARTRNEEYLARRNQELKRQENDERAA